MKAGIPALCIVASSLLSVVVLSGCGRNANMGDHSTAHPPPSDVTRRTWPDMEITGYDSEVANRQHLSVDKKVIDVWSTWSRGPGGGWASPVQILIGLRDHTRDELKNWKVKITCSTIWFGGFTTATIKIADGRFAQHPDYKNGVVVFLEGRQFNVTKLDEPRGLKVGEHTITVEILDEQDGVKGLATLPMTVFEPSLGHPR
jgi:hypothetical protein